MLMWNHSFSLNPNHDAPTYSTADVAKASACSSAATPRGSGFEVLAHRRQRVCLAAPAHVGGFAVWI